MSNRKRLFLEIGLLFVTIIFSNWLVSLGGEGPSYFMERPVRCLGTAALLSIVGGYALHRFKIWQEAKVNEKSKTSSD